MSILTKIKRFFKEDFRERKASLKEKIIWLKNHEQDILLALIVILLAMASFAFGLVTYHTIQKPPLIFHTP